MLMTQYRYRFYWVCFYRTSISRVFVIIKCSFVRTSLLSIIDFYSVRLHRQVKIWSPWNRCASMKLLTSQLLYMNIRLIVKLQGVSHRPVPLATGRPRRLGRTAPSRAACYSCWAPRPRHVPSNPFGSAARSRAGRRRAYGAAQIGIRFRVTYTRNTLYTWFWHIKILNYFFSKFWTVNTGISRAWNLKLPVPYTTWLSWREKYGSRDGRKLPRERNPKAR
jgi:hypothetical protein